MGEITHARSQLEDAVKTEVLETAAREHTSTARAAGTWASSSAALLGLRLLNVDGLRLGLPIVALLGLTAVGLLRRGRIVALLRRLLTVPLLRVACGKGKRKRVARDDNTRQ